MERSSHRRTRSSAFSPEQLDTQIAKNSKLEMPDNLEKVSNSDILARLNQLIVEKDARLEQLIIEKDLNSQTALIEVRDSVTSLTDKFEKSITELQTNVNQIYDKINERMKTLQSEVRVNSSNISFIAHEMDRLKFRKEVYIAGVPVTENESVSTIFGKICIALGYTEDNTPRVFLRRLKPKSQLQPSTLSTPTRTTSNNATVNPPPILVEFNYQNECIDFKSRYFSTRSLNLSCLGYGNNKRIFVNERLTKHDMDIKFKALKLKKDNLLHSVVVANGRVYIKPSSESKGSHIDDITDLPTKK